MIKEDLFNFIKRNEPLHVAIDQAQGMAKLFQTRTQTTGYLFILCTRGSCQLSTLLSNYTLSKNSLIVILPNSFLQVMKQSADCQLYITVFDKELLNNTASFTALMECVNSILQAPMLTLQPRVARIVKDYMLLLQRTIQLTSFHMTTELASTQLLTLFHSISNYYQTTAHGELSRVKELIEGNRRSKRTNKRGTKQAASEANNGNSDQGVTTNEGNNRNSYQATSEANNGSNYQATTTNEGNNGNSYQATSEANNGNSYQATTINEGNRATSETNNGNSYQGVTIDGGNNYGRTGRGEEIVKELTRHIIKHYRQERNVGFYANLLHISPQHLSSTVNKITSKTPTQIIAQLVITDACSKLRSSDMTIQQIAYSLNFPDISFFGKYFKRYTGVSPRQYKDGYPVSRL